MRLLLLACLLTLPCVAAAQFPAEVRPGARVRVWLPESRRQEPGPERRQLVRGTVESVDNNILRLGVPGTSGTLIIPRSTIVRLDASRGVNRFASAIQRAAGGAVGGAIIFALMNDPNRRGGPHYQRDWRAAGVGAEWGAAIGGALGLLFPHEQWRRVYGRWF
ncbi:MAG TPA: hypothetical protein VJ840_15375 [Gemmatimonadaceae bacterium]|nr:hypothetical protein [Gemmatimonadaceae bacterium]